MIKSTMSEVEWLSLDVELRKAEAPDIEEAAFDQIVEDLARFDYEASRGRVSGRPSWESLNPHDPYDMGMRQTALDRARAKIINSRVLLAMGYQAEGSGDD